MKIFSRKAAAVATAGLALAAVALSAGAAQADPTGTPTYRQLAGVGSDTTYAVLNALSNQIVDGSNTKLIASYDPSGAPVKTKATGCANLPRENGSGKGRDALLASLTTGSPTFGCYDFARSSSESLGAVPTATGGLTYVPFGIDAFTYAYKSGGDVPSTLTKDDLTAIYKCQVDGAYVPLLPQAGSGTRSYWLDKVVGITETQISNGTYPCIKDVKAGVPVQEHDGRVLTANNEIVPFSIASWVSQAAAAQTDNRGSAVLANTANTASLSAGSQTHLKREVFNVIPTTKTGTAPWSTVFVGPNSAVCQNQTIINRFGFASNPECGEIDKVTPLN